VEEVELITQEQEEQEELVEVEMVVELELNVEQLIQVEEQVVEVFLQEDFQEAPADRESLY
jgi:hypothetical protein